MLTRLGYATATARRTLKVLVLATTCALGCARATNGVGPGSHAGGGGGVGSGGGMPSNLDGGTADLAGDSAADLATPAPPRQCIIPTSSEFCPPAIYVSTGGDDTRTGTSPAQAVRRISTGITKAVNCGCVIVVAGGMYDEPLQLHDGISIYGGYAQDFKLRDPTANVVTITSSEERTVSADGLILPTILDGVTIAGATLASSDGRSSVALYVHASHFALSLSHAVVQAGRGADGTPGAAGVDLACGTTGASGGVSFDCGGSTGGSGNAAGDPLASGGGGTGGNSDCPDACALLNGDGVSDGTPGTPGGNGSDGVGGVAATDLIGMFVAGRWQGSLGTPGARGFNGTGGGGGGSGGTKRIRACFGCGTLLGGRGGDGAPGGCGGGGGAPGGAGGGSFGLVLDNADVNLDTVSIAGGNGGNGGLGGAGRAGQAGGTVVNNGLQGAAETHCGLGKYDSGGGGLGGVGGKGGNGGGGAGGVGGPAIALVRIGGSTANMTGAQLTAGTPGNGGAGGSGPGTSGAAGPAGTVATDRNY